MCVLLLPEKWRHPVSFSGFCYEEKLFSVKFYKNKKKSIPVLQNEYEYDIINVSA
jgi:hypothetical protein